MKLELLWLTTGLLVTDAVYRAAAPACPQPQSGFGSLAFRKTPVLKSQRWASHACKERIPGYPGCSTSWTRCVSSSETSSRCTSHLEGCFFALFSSLALFSTIYPSVVKHPQCRDGRPTSWHPFRRRGWRLSQRRHRGQSKKPPRSSSS